MDDPELQELLVKVERLVRDAYRRGLEKGAQESEALKTKVFEAMGVSPPKADAAPVKVKRATRASLARAPKGLVRTALEAVFLLDDGYTTKEIEAQAVAFDNRINPKTVYNELLRQDAYERRDGRWYLRASTSTEDFMN